MTEEQKAQIPVLLERGPEAYSFRGEVWTRERITMVIEREFGVSYHPVHVGRILKSLNWTRQKPTRRANQRNEEVIQGWQTERWPEVKKGPKGPRRKAPLRLPG